MIARLLLRCAAPAVALLVFASPRALADSPTDYAYGWPLVLGGESGAWQLELPPEVYEVVQDESLRDLEIFDAKGSPVPMAPYSLADEPRPAERAPLPVFALRRGADGQGVDLRIQFARGSDRSIHRVDAQLASTSEAPAAPVDHLVDASRIEGAIEALWLSWPDATGDTRASFAVEASDDLERWRTLVGAATVLELHGGGETLSRRRIDLPPTRSAYLRLRALAPNDLPDLRVEAQLSRQPAAAHAMRWLEATLVSQTVLTGEGDTKRGVYTYETPAAYPANAVRIAPGNEGALARIEVSSEGPGQRWIDRASFTLVGVGQGDEQVRRNEAAVSASLRTRRWRIEATPPLEAAPGLQIALRPDRFAFLPRGAPPYLLAAGSHLARRTDAPMGTAIAELRARLGSEWRPPTAGLGERGTLAGEAALAPPPAPLPWKRWILWSVLVAGAGLVGLLSIRLLRRSPGGT